MQSACPTHTLIYQADKQKFLQDVDRYIEDQIELQYQLKLGKNVSPQEKQSWRNSLQEMARILRNDSIPATSGVGIELFAPQSMSRIDFTLTGYDEYGHKKAIIIELKQWSSIQLTSKDAIVRTQLGGGLNEAIHPSYQAWSYAMLFESFNESVSSGDIKVLPGAFLHNYPESDNTILDERFKEYVEQAPLFRKGLSERDKLLAFLSKHIRKGDQQAVLQQLISSRIGASKVFVESLAQLMKGNAEFALINDQKLVFESIKEIARAAAPGKHKVIIVEGGAWNWQNPYCHQLVGQAATDWHDNQVCFQECCSTPCL